MTIRPLGEADAVAYWNLRLEGLQNDPLAFGMAAEHHKTVPVEAIAIRLREMDVGSFYLGAFDGEALIGIATFVRNTGAKERHKGNIYGVYVTASRRGQGAGRALMEATLNKAKQDPTLEQILLAVASRQTPARHLYRKLGFKVYGVEPRALKVASEYVDEEHMVLMLSPL